MSVVLPASGCEMMAKLLRRLTSSRIDVVSVVSGELMEVPREKRHYKGFIQFICLALKGLSASRAKHEAIIEKIEILKRSFKERSPSVTSFYKTILYAAKTVVVDTA